MSAADIILMLISLFGGLGIFMFGMRTLQSGLEKTAGDKLKTLLQSVTKNRFLSLLCGIAITILIQSSTATTVMVVGFVNANMLSLTQAIGVIMGANIGTTVTPLILSLEGIEFGMIFAFIGLLLSSLPKRRELMVIREFGPIIMGIALLFVGMKAMSTAMAPMQQWDGFKQAMQNISSPIIGVLLGAVICIVLNSSAASVGLLQAMAGQGLIPLSTAIFILFGQNIGTCLTSLIAGAGTSTAARRASIVHLLFNVIGTALFVTFACICPFADWIQAAAPDNLKLQIALVHIIFNIATTLVLFPCAKLLEKLACLLVRDKDSEKEEMRLKYFDRRLLNTPPIAVAQLHREVQRMGGLAVDNYRRSFACFEIWDEQDAEKVSKIEDVLDFLYREIGNCLTAVKGLDLSEKDGRLVTSLFHVTNDLERIGDHSMNIMESGQKRHQEDIQFQPEVLGDLKKMNVMVDAQLTKALDLFVRQNSSAEALEAVEASENEIDNITENLRLLHLDRLKNKKCSPRNGFIFLDMITNLERIGDHAENIATSVPK